MITHVHNGIKYVSFDEFLSDIDLKYTFIYLLKKDKTLSTFYCDELGNELYDIRKLKRRLDKLKLLYYPPGYIRLCDYCPNDYVFSGKVGGLKLDRILLPLYTKRGLKDNRKKWIIYKKEQLEQLKNNEL